MNTRRLNLEPKDSSSFRSLAHSVLDRCLDDMEQLASRPVWQPIPADVRASLAGEALPLRGVGETAALDDVFTRVAPFVMGSRHPRFWAWVQGSGFPLAAVTDLIASTLNAHLAGFDQSPALVEETTIRWLRELMGFPSGASGVFCSSGTMANLLGLVVARHQRGRARPVVYASTEVHGWIRKALTVQGLSAESLHSIPVLDDFTIDADALSQAIAADRAAGLNPMCVIGTAGTVNTGAIDPLKRLASICSNEGLWFHVDGAFGAMARLHPDFAPLLKGLELADSLAFDLHKWGSMPFACAVLLVRDSAAHRTAFASTPSYMAPTTRGPLAGGVPFADRGIDLSRGFDSLKVWVALRAFGVSHFAELIRQNVEDARQFAGMIQSHAEFELLAPVPLNIVCFRYVRQGADHDALNQEILLRLQESGTALISSTVIGGKFALRLAHVNQRSTPQDFAILLEALTEIAAGLD